MEKDKHLKSKRWGNYKKSTSRELGEMAPKGGGAVKYLDHISFDGSLVEEYGPYR